MEPLPNETVPAWLMVTLRQFRVFDEV